MAHMLTGEGGHSTYAPLSYAQTRELAQHLEALIREAQHETAELKAELSRADGEIAALRTAQGSTGAAISSLRETQQHLLSVIDGMKGDISRTADKVNGLQQHHEVHSERTNGHRENIRLMDTGIQSLRQEVAALGAHLKDLQTDREVGIGADVARLMAAAQQSQAAVKAQKEDLERTKAGLNEERVKTRQTAADLASVMDDLAKTNTQTGVLETRIAETMAHVKATKACLADTNGAVSRLHDEHKALRGVVATNQEELKKCTASIKKLMDGSDNAAARIAMLDDQLRHTKAIVTSNRDGMEKCHIRVGSLEDAQARVQATVVAMQLNLDNTTALAQHVKDRLRETNALVLPNLQRDGGARPRSISQANAQQRGHDPIKHAPGPGSTCGSQTSRGSSWANTSLQSTGCSWSGALTARVGSPSSQA